MARIIKHSLNTGCILHSAGFRVVINLLDQRPRRHYRPKHGGLHPFRHKGSRPSVQLARSKIMHDQAGIFLVEVS